MNKLPVVIVVSCLGASVSSASEFGTGCERAVTEVWCEGHTDCKVSSIMDNSQKGNVVDKVLIMPGVYSEDQTSYGVSVQKFIEKML